MLKRVVKLFGGPLDGASIQCDEFGNETVKVPYRTSEPKNVFGPNSPIPRERPEYKIASYRLEGMNGYYES